MHLPRSIAWSSVVLATLALTTLWMTACARGPATVVSGALPPATGSDWTHWRGPTQDGVSSERGLPDTWEPGGANHLWAVDLAGRGTPVVHGERVYAFGYRGEGAEMQEVLVCLDAATGRELWSHGYSDFLSDIIYSRYSIGSPTVDPQTGNVYVLTSPGLFMAFTADGRQLWQHSLMEEIGRMTFPNGRTGSPSVAGDLVIFHAITSNWGAHGPPQDRFYAFDKRSGAPVWVSAPGVRPKDNSFSNPVFAKAKGRDVFYAGTGCGNVVCVDTLTGDPLWRFQLSAGGVNSTIALHGDDRLIAVHGRENIDTSEIGRLVSIKRDYDATPAAEGTPVMAKTAELWRNPAVSAFTSSPVVVGDRIYITEETGDLLAIDALTGKLAWEMKLGIEQLHASPLYADGKLYIPVKHGDFVIIRPGPAGGEVLSKARLAGECNGAPAAAHGRIYVHTTEKLYCFGTVRRAALPKAVPAAPLPVADGPVARLQVVPSDVLLHPGGAQPIAVRGITADGRLVELPAGSQPAWTAYVPATAKVKAALNGGFQGSTLMVKPEPLPSAGMFEASVGEAKGYLRGRVLPDLPLSADFEKVDIAVEHATEQGVRFGYPPLPWIGARFKWEVRELDGNKVLTKTIDNRILQRALTFIGHPEMTGYTIAADVLSDGNKRKMSEVGLIVQRYAVVLKGNAQELEVSSNFERLRESVPFKWAPGTWYRLQARVDIAADGSGVVRAKAWKRGEPEPAAWNIEVKHGHAHANGSPGVFGFSPTDMRVYIDNIAVTPGR